MGAVVEKLTAASLFNLACDFWNQIIVVAMTLFTTSPSRASGGVYAITKTCFGAIKSISIPIATMFFIFAILKEVIATPPEQQARRFLQSALKYGILVGILANLWEFMGYVMQIADGITDAVSISGSYRIEPAPELAAMIRAVENPTYETPFDVWTVDTWMPRLEEFSLFQIQKVVLLFAGIGSIFVTVGAGITILSCAFQRIIKPLVLLPFSTITIALASGSGEAERVSVSYVKTLFGLCLSGAMMVIAVKIGAALMSSGLVTLTATDGWGRILAITVQNCITPMMIAGLVKNSESMISRFF